MKKGLTRPPPLRRKNWFTCLDVAQVRITVGFFLKASFVPLPSSFAPTKFFYCLHFGEVGFQSGQILTLMNVADIFRSDGCTALVTVEYPGPVVYGKSESKIEENVFFYKSRDKGL